MAAPRIETKTPMRIDRKPAILEFDDRFARQNRFGLPPEFPLALTYPSIVRYLSGRNRYAITRSLLA